MVRTPPVLCDLEEDGGGPDGGPGKGMPGGGPGRGMPGCQLLCFEDDLEDEPS